MNLPLILELSQNEKGDEPIYRWYLNQSRNEKGDESIVDTWICR